MRKNRLNTTTTGSLLLDQPLELESGATLDHVEVAYRTLGVLSPSGDNAVVVCHALTGSAGVDQWWPELIGPGRCLDPERDFIVCSNVLGGCYGTTGPASPRHPSSDRWGPDFPDVTVRDMVEVQRRLLDSLGVRRVRLVIGGSLGGMQALEWSLLDRRVEAAVVIAASARHSAWCIAQNEAQRTAITADPRWDGGRYRPDNPPRDGLVAARMMAMCSYRSPESLGQRFGREGEDDDFHVGGWLRYHGEALADRFDAGCYVTITKAMDRHDVGRGRGGVDRALASLDVPLLVVAIDSDGLYPPAEQKEIAALVPGARFEWLYSSHGHDAFLIETDQVDAMVRRFRHRTAAPVVSVAC